MEASALATAPPLSDVAVASLDPTRFRDVVDADVFAQFERAIAISQETFRGRVIWNVNSTAHGGGVAEMLWSLLGYIRGAGVDTRWVVIGGEPAFFRVTKRLHNHLHGSAGDGGPLGDAEHAAYEAALSAAAKALTERVRARDIVVLHDPQTAGLVAPLKRTGARVVWRCHVGVDVPGDLARQAWRFLGNYLGDADAYVFSRSAYAFEGLEADRVHVIPPSIDAFSPKNADLEAPTVDAILKAAGIVDGGPPVDPPEFRRRDGSPGRVDQRVRRADSDQEAPHSEAPTVVQVSRWDRLKDPVGVLHGFAEHIAPRHADVHLILAGPDVAAVSDDPEGAQVLAEVVAECEGLPHDVRRRAHLLCLPMSDEEVNAAMVNALQRHATVAVQKSLAEGFGLTVAEAMWKGRPVVASRIGGIQDQVEDGVTGILLDDPRDGAEFGRAVSALLGDPQRAEGMGAAARARVRSEFLGPRHLMRYVDVLSRWE